MKTNKLTLGLAAAAAIGTLAVNGAVASASVAISGTAVNLTAAQLAAGDPDVEITKECVQASPDLPDPASWRPGVRYDLAPELGYLVIRNDQYARLCVVRDGKGTGTLRADSRHGYGNLTAARPFDYLGTVEFSIHFGIVTNDVAAVSLVQPDKSVVPAVVRDGTFVAAAEFPEDPQVPTTNYVRATLKNGQVIEGPFRTFVGGGTS